MSYRICSFYNFVDLSNQVLSESKSSLEKEFSKYDLSGIIILATEGINGTVCVEQNQEVKILDFLNTNYKVNEVKFASCEKQAFPRFKVRLREEIVTTKEKPNRLERTGKHLNAKQWHEVIESEEDINLIDTRNWYETDLGTFKNALDPRLVNFQEFSEYVQKQNTHR